VGRGTLSRHLSESGSGKREPGRFNPVHAADHVHRLHDQRQVAAPEHGGLLYPPEDRRRQDVLARVHRPGH